MNLAAEAAEFPQSSPPCAFKEQSAAKLEKAVPIIAVNRKLT
jgi:hypothetical protein